MRCFFAALSSAHVPFDEFTPQNMSNFAWGIASAGAQDTNLLLALGREAVTRLHDFKEQELSNLVWAFATCDLVDNLLLHNVALETMKRSAESFDPQSISNLLWAYAALAVKDVVLLDQMTVFGIENVRGFSSQELANSTWATAMLMFRNEEFLDAVAGEIVARITPDQTDPIHLAQLMWAFSRFHYTNLPCIEKLVQLTLATLQFFAPQSIIDVHDALLSFNLDVPPAIEAKVCGIAHEIKTLLLRDIPQQAEYKDTLESLDVVTLGYKYTMEILDELGCYNESFLDVGREEARRWRAEAAAIDSSSRAAFHRSQAVWRIGESVTVEASGPPVDPGGLVAIRLKHFRGGDAEFRALAQVASMSSKPPSLEIHVSEVPCLSCLGAMVQFHNMFDVDLRVCFDRGRQCPKNEDVPYWMLSSTLANRVAFAEATRGTAPKDAIVKNTLTLEEVMAGAHKCYNKTKNVPVDKTVDRFEAFNRASANPRVRQSAPLSDSVQSRGNAPSSTPRDDSFAAFYPQSRVSNGAQGIPVTPSVTDCANDGQRIEQASTSNGNNGVIPSTRLPFFGGNANKLLELDDQSLHPATTPVFQSGTKSYYSRTGNALVREVSEAFTSALMHESSARVGDVLVVGSTYERANTEQHVHGELQGKDNVPEDSGVVKSFYPGGGQKQQGKQSFYPLFGISKRQVKT